MNLSDLASKAVQEEFEAIEAALPQPWRSLASMFSQWRRYAESVAVYPGDIDDYMGMLFTRDLIQQLTEGASLTARAIIDAVVAEADWAFLHGTTEDRRDLLAGAFDRPRSGWWWRRIPVSLVPDAPTI